MLIQTSVWSEIAAHEKHSVNVVDVTVLPATVMDVIPRHANLGTVENRGVCANMRVRVSSVHDVRTSFMSFQM